ncbi:histone deacetylase complex subunit SAP130-like isoform X1 [Stegodyphus dumicola]|uniref:histone deacetylase complex subunit SAP130-like isoform X1 n=1 Tax=Stegodyphus dumicola TaxID=202533 RepID=UPI0015B03BF3|nr:histone deacetylase complex subunit SAP130-like isoform X1 [Stegodyphus dumicola]
MNNQKAENKSADHEDSDHIQPINLVATRTPVPVTTFSGSNTPVATQPLPMRPHIEPKPGLMTLYFRTPSTRPQGQLMGPVVGTQVSSAQHFAAKQAQDFKNTNISSWTVIRMPTSDITQAQSGTTTPNSSGNITPGILPSALSGSTNRHMIPTAVHPVIAAGSSGPSMASIIRGSHQVAPAGHVIQPPFSSHVPRGPAAVASISAAPKSAVATPILRTPHSSATMALASSSMMALHTPVRAKSPTLVGRTSTPPVAAASSLPQVVDLQKSSVGHTIPSSTAHVGLSTRPVDGSVVRSGSSHSSSSITIAKPINISQPIVQHLQQVYDKGSLKTVSNLSSTTNSPSNSTPAHQSTVPGTFASTNDNIGVVPTISRTAVSTGYSTGIMQLSSAATVAQSLQQLRATHVPQAMHALTNVTTSVTPHQTLTVISAKSLMPTNHSIALATPPARTATPNSAVTASGTSSIIPGPPSRPLNASSTVSSAAIPVAKVYPQAPATPIRTASETTQENANARPNSFITQPVASNANRVTTPTTTATSGLQTVMIAEKQGESNSVRFSALPKPQLGSSASFTPSPATYLYHDQYTANLAAMHPYNTNPTTQGFTATQLRPVSFSQHASNNASAHPSISVSNPVQPINSVMVAVDSRHHVALHSSYNTSSSVKGADVSLPIPSSNTVSSGGPAVTCVVTTSYNSLQQSQSGINNHTSPRPSILRKRTGETVCNIVKRNLTANLCNSEPISPRVDVNSNITFTSVLSPKPVSEKTKENTPSNVPVTSENQNISVPMIPPSAIKKEPGVSESTNITSDTVGKDNRPVEASPRKKPRKQLLYANSFQIAANELMETHSSEGEENNFDVKVKIKEELGVKEEEKTKCVTFYKRPTMSLLSSYHQPWKARHNHFARYSDVKPKEEKKPTVNELANQKGILQLANGWKVYHLTTQMDEVIGLEETVYSRLSHLLNFVENDPPALRNRTLLNSDEDRIINKLTDLIKGNLQRSKIVQEQVTESKQLAIKVLDHKANIVEMVNKYISKRPLKKKEKS